MDRELERRKSRGTRILLVALIVWGLAVAVAAEAGIFRAVYPLLLAPIIALGVVVPVIVYALSDGFRTYIEAIGLRPLTAFHIWRIPAALLFFWYGAHDLLPEAFVRNAGWGDLIAGLLALGCRYSSARESQPIPGFSHLWVRRFCRRGRYRADLVPPQRSPHVGHRDIADGPDPTLRRRYFGCEPHHGLRLAASSHRARTESDARRCWP